jgi:hypothetical protein
MLGGMRGKVLCGVALLGGLFALVPMPATAGTVPYDGQLLAAPVLAGGDAVWVEGSSSTQLLRIKRSSPDGPPVTLHETGGDSAGCQVVRDFAASGARVALLHRASSYRDAGCSQGASELHVLDASGTLHLVEGGQPEPSDCTPTSLDLEGDLLAVTRINCPGQELVIRDLGTGGAAQRVSWTPGDAYFGMDSDVELGGRYVAFHPRDGDVSNGRIVEIIVWDRIEDREVYRVDAMPFLGRDPPVNYEIDFKLQPDGKLLIGTEDYYDFVPWRELRWFSIDDQRPHSLGVATPSRQFGFANDLISLARGDDDLAVIDLAGTTRHVFERHTPNTLVNTDFDGSRLLWVKGAAIRNEPFPPAPVPAATPAVQLKASDLATPGVQLKASDLTPRPGQRVRLRGWVRPWLKGTVAIERRSTNGSFRRVTTAKLRRAGANRSTFVAYLRPRSSGLYRARLPGDRTHLAGVSGTVLLRVR